MEHKIFKKVEGNCGKYNDVIIFNCKNQQSVKYNLIYFGGDIQDYEEEMKKSNHGRDYSEWNLIETGSILSSKFAKDESTLSNVFIIRADFFHLKCFANYSNFVNSNDFGVPLTESELVKEEKLENDANNLIDCWSHLTAVFHNSITLFNDNESTSNDNLIDINLPIIIVSFSKGCIVLNELCNELIKLKNIFDDKNIDNKVIQFYKKIKHLFWLDGGHSGGSNGWITISEIIEEIKHLNWSCYVFVTPYQIKSRKTWAIKEYHEFINLLSKFNVNMKNVYYFEEKEDDFDIDIHFQILKTFDTSLI